MRAGGDAGCRQAGQRLARTRSRGRSLRSAADRAHLEAHRAWEAKPWIRGPRLFSAADTAGRKPRNPQGPGRHPEAPFRVGQSRCNSKLPTLNAVQHHLEPILNRSPSQRWSVESCRRCHPVRPRPRTIPPYPVGKSRLPSGQAAGMASWRRLRWQGSSVEAGWLVRRRGPSALLRMDERRDRKRGRGRARTRGRARETMKGKRRR
ncbi:hypothetical protein VTJ83DRAFT_5376 [Remersonia thermophila]|uniref:Uncharacterized protein n=1 Tax=Remersonia thermophila TaxID=72144 RepID=A0ABR4D8U6_9PEZI